jgi:predicted RNase H-like HicB family nuclease
MKLLEEINQDLQKREAKGINTYGTTLDDANLNREELLNHLYEELLDSVFYIKKLINDKSQSR